jgi:UDP-N-acetylglucosamine--N-acetylmuramyl-(pentapeptide) pyrophosphoryl-undecaprenol N-acetylglucosamine transferase
MPHSQNYFQDKSKLVFTGTPIRAELLQGDAARGLQWLGFNQDKPLLMVYGGGLGSVVINQAIREALPQLLSRFNVVHGCGKGKMDQQFDHIAGYRQFDYISKELPDVLAAADLVVSRAGANSIYELLTLRKPHLLIPLSKKASRGDQIENAQYFSALGVSEVLSEEELNAASLIEHIDQLWQKRAVISAKMQQLELPNAVERLMSLMQEA